MKLDQTGREFLQNILEGLKLKPYRDIKGVWTIGFGHIDGVNEWTPEITEAQANILFDEDLEPVEEAVTNAVEIELNPNEFTALVSFTFNEGIHAFVTSELLVKLNSGNRRGAAKQFDRWIYYRDPVTNKEIVSKGLVNRRAKEKALFLSETPTLI